MTVTYFQFLKYKREIANVSISYNDAKHDLELPSITFCPFNPAPDVDRKYENMTFDEYMEYVLNVSDFFNLTAQSVYLPGLTDLIER